MQGIKVRTDKKARTAQRNIPDAPRILDSIKDMIQGRAHPKSGLQFGGSILSPHISKAQFEKEIRPAHDKLLDLGGSARDHPVADSMLHLQEKLLKSKPKLKREIANLHVGNKNLQALPNNPFEHMNDKQLYHHLMTMPHDKWANVQETAGVMMGKRKSRLGSALPITQLHKIVSDHVPDLHDIIKGTNATDEHVYNKASHMLDISHSRLPKIAAERLEREVEGGSFGTVLKSALWLDAVSDLKRAK